MSERLEAIKYALELRTKLVESATQRAHTTSNLAVQIAHSPKNDPTLKSIGEKYAAIAAQTLDRCIAMSTALSELEAVAFAELEDMIKTRKAS